MDSRDPTPLDRAYRRRLPYMVAGGIALLVGVALLANGPLHGMWAAGAVAVGVVLILLGEFFARH
jgi:hypothetical protein